MYFPGNEELDPIRSELDFKIRDKVIFFAAVVSFFINYWSNIEFVLFRIITSNHQPHSLNYNHSQALSIGGSMK